MESHQDSPQDASTSSLDWAEETRAQTDGRAPSVYQRSLEATRDKPEDAAAWIARAEAAQSTEEKIFCLSQVNRLDPTHPKGREQMHETLWGELRRDSFLSYLEETDHIYYVRNKDFTSLAIAKDRSGTETYPPEKLSEVDLARRRLGWAIAGLALSGLGTLVFAPLAIRSSANVLRESGDRRDRVRAWIMIALALTLMPVALLLAWVLAIHF